MNKGTPHFEWQIREGEEEWQLLSLSPDVAASPNTFFAYLQSQLNSVWRRYVWGGGIALLLLFTVTGAWLWQRAEAGLDQVEAEVRKVALEGRAREHDTSVHILNLQGDLAVAKIVTAAQEGKEAYRQLHFYQEGAAGWVRTTPRADLWGSPRQLESAHFIFHYRHNDGETVATVAAQLDTLYAKMQGTFGLSPSPDKIVVKVNFEEAQGAIVSLSWQQKAIVVPSPAIYLVPAEVSDEELLAQSIALPLTNYMTERLIEEYSIPWHWQPIGSGLRLWQLWELETPLAEWRDEIVTWLYADLNVSERQWYSAQPQSYQELCAVHKLWMESPLMIGIPLECLPEHEGSRASMRMLMHGPITKLEWLTMPLSEYSSYVNELYYFPSTQVVAVATLFEYAVATYGQEQLPTLLVDMKEYDAWETLIPAVYGVSAEDFEKGWQRYLAARYQ